MELESALSTRPGLEEGQAEGNRVTVILAGPPHSGKSVLRELLKSRILDLHLWGPYPYVITGNPDGEGAWFQRAVSAFPEQAREQRERYKTEFTEALVTRIAASVQACREPLVLVDIGGKITTDNERICCSATHIVILYKTEKDLSQWREFASRLGLRVLAEVESAYHDSADRIVQSSRPLQGSIHRLERGELKGSRPMVDALAELILDLVEPSWRARSAKGNTMGKTFRVERSGQVIRTRFGDQAEHDVIVPEAHETLREMVDSGSLDGGGIIGINGPCSVVLAYVLCHAVAHLFAAVAVWDPKLDKYVVTVSHDAEFPVGRLLDEVDLMSASERAQRDARSGPLERDAEADA